MTIEELELQIESDAQGAVSGINNLTGALTSLKGATSNSAGLSKVATALTGVKTAVSGLNLGNFGAQMQQLSAGLAPLQSLGKNNLSSFTKSLQQIPAVTATLQPDKMTAFAAGVQRVADAMKPLASEMDKIGLGFSTMPANLQKFITQMERSGKSASSAAQGYGKAATGIAQLNAKANLGILYAGLRRITNILSGFVDNANQYVEDINLFTVSMGEYADSAYEYAQKAQALMGIDAGQFMRNQGFFQSIASGFGVASDSAALMSQNLAQLGYDLASFYNSDVDVAMQKLQSGLAGELEPLRRWGFALDQVTLQEVALSHGINMNIRDMTQAQKSMIRYIAIMEQSVNAQHDMARTLTTPANAMRVMSQQVTLLGRSIGNVLIPAMSAILPYAIAVAKAIRAVMDVIAGFFGYTFPEIDYDAFGGLDVGVAAAEDMEDALTGAGAAAKKLRDYVMGFDELNIIRPEEPTGGGAGAGSAAGAGFENLELPSYDFLEGLSAQADKALEKLKEFLPALLAVGAAFGLLKFASWADGLSRLSQIFAGLALAIAGTVVYVVAFSDAWKNGLNWLNLTGMLIGATAAMVGLSIAISPVVGGIAGVAAGIGILVVSIRDLIQSGPSMQNVVGIITGIGVSVAGLITVFGKWGAIISPFTTIFGNLKGAFSLFRTDVASFIPVGSSFSKRMGEMSKATQASLSPIQKATVAIAGIAIIVTTVYTQVKSLTKTILSGSASFGDFAKAGLILIPVLAAVGVAMYAALGPVGLIIAAVAALVAGIVAVVSAVQEHNKEMAVMAVFAENGGIPVKALTDNFIAFTESVKANNAAILENSEEFSELSTSIDVSASRMQNLMATNEMTAEQASTVLPIIADEYAKMSDSIIQKIDIAAQTLTAAFINLPQEALDAAQTTLPELAGAVAAAASGMTQEVLSLNEEWARYMEILDKDPTNAEALAGIQQISERLAELGGTTTTAADDYSAAVDAMVPVDFSSLIVEGDTEATLQNMNALLGDVATAGADAQAELARSYEASSQALEAMKEGLDPQVYEQMKEALASGFEIDSARIQAEQEQAIADIRSGFQAQVTAMSENIEGSDWNKFWLGEEEANRRAQQKFLDTFSDVFDTFDMAAETASLGADAVAGLAEGIRSGDTSAVKANADALAETIPNQIAEKLGIASPAKVTMDQGLFTVQGLAKGISDNVKLVTKPAGDLGKSTVDAISNSLNKNAPAAVQAFKNMLNQMLTALQGFSVNVANAMNGTLSGMASSINNTRMQGQTATPGRMSAVSVPMLAGGGMVNTGQVFIANENGPEFIGRVGNKTGVANNEQMTEQIYQAAYQGFSDALRENAELFQNEQGDIIIGDETIVRSYERGVNQMGNAALRRPTLTLG